MSAPTLDRAALPAELGALLADACQCGCGRPAPIARKTDRRIGAVAGQPRRYIRGHNTTWARALVTRSQRREVPAVRATPEPGPWARICTLCPWPLVSGAARAPRGFRVHAGRGLCQGCHRRASAGGTLLDHERLTRSADDLLDEWEILRGQGYGRRRAAERLGMTLDAFEAALRRADDPRAVWSVR